MTYLSQYDYIDTILHELNCKVLIKSPLDEDWSDVTLKFTKTEILMYIDKSYFDKDIHNKRKKLLTEHEKVKSSIIPIHHIVNVIKDIETLTIRIETKSIKSSSIGYYLFKLDDVHYEKFLSYLSFTKSIKVMNKNKRQDL